MSRSYIWDCRSVHVAPEEQVAQLRGQVAKQFECVETITTWLSPALGVHSGPGTVGVHFYLVG